MNVISESKKLTELISGLRKEGKTIGFVPTMGALHDGHISLVSQAEASVDVVVVSIFVNPTQFNNAEDLEKYPRTLDADLEKLSVTNCKFVFAPNVDEIYPSDYEEKNVDISPLDEVMEGKHRPGHFSGVVNVVSRFFEIVQPDLAFFGRKDFQQVAIIRRMTDLLEYPVQIVCCETKREDSGLAMSSRNTRLSEKEKEDAVILYETLKFGLQLADNYTPDETLDYMMSHFEGCGLELEYLEIVDPDWLLPLQDYWVPGATACIVAYCGDVRLIDNMELVSDEF